MVTLTEPYAVPTVHIGVTEHARGEVILKTGYPVYHPETVMEGVVMKNTAFPSHNPQRVLRVGVEPVQIDLRGHLQIAVKNSVMPDPLAVITVHPLLGEEPHVSPPVFLDTVNPPVTQSVLYSQVFIYLGSAHGGNSQHEECGQYSSHIPNTCHSDVN